MSRRWLLALVLSTLAAGTAWYRHGLQREGSAGRVEGAHRPDFYMESFSSLTTDVRGMPRRRLSGERLDHYPDTDTHEITQPHLELYEEGREPWHVASERGWVSPDRDVILLQGRVYVWRQDPSGQRVMDIVTRDVRVLPEKEYAETEEPALIRTPDTETRGVGMRAWLGESRVELLSQVRTVVNEK
jgi:lipopolysaccharide export system protein LptC